MVNKYRVTPKMLYICILIIIPLMTYTINPTYSKFTQTITTEEDIVNINTNINIEINNVNEYKKIKVGSNDYEIYNLELKNNKDKLIYFGLWHSLEKETIKGDLSVYLLKDKDTNIKYELQPKETITIPLIIKNNSNTNASINIGVLSSEESLDSIKYKDNQIQIIKETYETDIYYDNITNKYYYSLSNTEIQFANQESTFNYNDDYQTFTAQFSGYYQTQMWGPSTINQGGDYLSTDIYLKQNQSVYFYIGKSGMNDISSETDLRLIPSKRDNLDSLNSRIAIAGNDINNTYIYSYEKNNQEKDAYKLDSSIKYNLRTTKNSIVIPKSNQSNGFATISYLGNQEPTIEGIKYVYKNTDYKLENIICKDNGRGCKLIKVRPQSTKDLDTGIYEITYIVSDNDNITYKYKSTFEVIEKE